MKERTMEAIAFAEEYFVAVIEEEAGNKVVPSRTEELHWAIEGLEGIAVIKYKQFLKTKMKEGMMNMHDAKILSR